MSAPDTIGVAFAALGDATRRGAVHLLAEHGRSAGELASELDVSPALLTRHLRVLRDAGLVRASLDPHDQRRHQYELVDAPLRDLRDWVDEVTAYWERQLDAFVAHVESTNLEPAHHEPTQQHRKEVRRARR